MATQRKASRWLAVSRAAAVMLAVVGIDQLTKHTVGTGIAPDQTVTLIPGLLHLVYERNTGVAFGFLSGGGALVYALTGVAVLALVGYVLARPDRPWLWLPAGMLIGGAIGNLIDRIFRGSVIDFIKLPHWPAFNLADTAITLGVVVLVFLIDGSRADSRPPSS